MDPILQIIHYLFKKKNITNTDYTFKSFFDNGIAFPEFVAIAFNVDEIPRINLNPKLTFNKNLNNSIALQYVFDHNPAISETSPNYTTDQDKANLLSLILTKQCFSLNIRVIANKCNLIVKPLGINYSKKKEILNVKCLFQILNVLTDGKVSKESEQSDLEIEMQRSFEIANVPLIINTASPEFQTRFLFLIQLEIIFDIYSDKIKQIIEEEESNIDDPELQKEIEMYKEYEKQKQLAKEKMKKELEKQKEEKKEIEKKTEINQVKDIQKQKEMEQKEIERRNELEKQIEQQKQKELKEQKEKEELKQFEERIEKDQELNVPDETEFSDFDMNDENTDDKKSTDYESESDDKKSSESDDDEIKIDDQKSTQNKIDDQKSPEIKIDDQKSPKVKFGDQKSTQIKIDDQKSPKIKIGDKSKAKAGNKKTTDNKKNRIRFSLETPIDDESIPIDSIDDYSVSIDSSFDTEDDSKKRRISSLSSKFNSLELRSFSLDSNSTFSLSSNKDVDSESSGDLLSDDDDVIEVHDYDSDDMENERNVIVLKESQKDDKVKKQRDKINHIRKKRIKTETGKLEDIDDDKLLDIINAIAFKSYENISQAISNDGIPKFVMHVLKVKSIKNVVLTKSHNMNDDNDDDIKIPDTVEDDEHVILTLTKNELRNIKEVINYLSKKEPKFSVLLFDFSKLVYVESSAILFYRTFISFFFLKKSKKELFERCVTLISNTIQKKDLKNEKKILTDWNTYVKLASFLFYKTLHFDLDFDAEIYFKKVQIPVIVDKSFLLRLINQTEMPISIYCQLQFIFDRIDAVGKSYHVVETFAKAMKVLDMKVPKSGVLASSIRAKNISLILQKKEYNNYVIQKQIYESIDGYDQDEEEKELQLNKNKMPSPPMPFNEREHTVDIINSIKSFKKSIRETKSADSYWNRPDLSYSFENGILFKTSLHNKRKDQAQSDWINEMNNIKKGATERLTKDDMMSESKSKKEIFYKFFIYNQEFKKWELNGDQFDLFQKDKNIYKNESKTPLVLFMNSRDKDLKNIVINSKIIFHDYPELKNDNQIFVYGIGDLFFSKFKSPDHVTIENEIINPIFLFLHIPPRYYNMPNISTVVYSIYTFLCFICDIEIIILNKKYYNDQIDFIKSINFITHSYKEIYKNEPNSIVSMKKSSELHLLSLSNSSDDENDIFDDEFDDYEDNDDEIISYSTESSIKNSYISFSNISSKVFTKKRKFIALFNDENELNSYEIIQNFYRSDFFNDLKKNIDPLCQAHFINLKDVYSYEPFMNYLRNICISNEVSTFGDVSKNFKLTQLTQISSRYIKLKNDSNWEEKLNQLIQNRYKILAKDDNLNCQYITILANLREEISTMSPSIDSQFKKKCDDILNEIKKVQNKNNQMNFINEIENSSEMNLSYLMKIINNEKFWSDNERDYLKNSHIQFLKEEFLNLIKTFYPNDLIKSIYEEYRDILNEQIKKDLDVIDNYFIKFTQKQAFNQINNLKRVDGSFKNKAKRGTNYAVREAENTREILVTVQLNSDLTSEIKQDF